MAEFNGSDNSMRNKGCHLARDEIPSLPLEDLRLSAQIIAFINDDVFLFINACKVIVNKKG